MTPTDRARQFPVTEKQIFLAHAAVAPLPAAAAEAMCEFAQRAARGNPENEWAISRVAAARRSAATLLGARPAEVALLGPTAACLSQAR